LILADEPSCHQDLDRLRLVWELLRETADRGAAVLAATHDPDAWGYADRILDLKEGRLTPAA
jgi:putative ABC transport system ATP-binding protein